MTVSRFTMHAAIIVLGMAWLSQPVVAGQAAPRSFSGFAAYYSESAKVASGQRFDPNGFTAAHRSLPFGTRVRVTDPKSGRNVIVTINDRGPFNKGRVIDVSLAAARVLGMINRGIMFVRADVL
jgi:rare lipoprotein A